MWILDFLAYPSVTLWVGLPIDIIPGVATQQKVMDCRHDYVFEVA